MKRFNIFSLVVSGLVATAVMAVMTMVAPMMGMPKMNIPGMLAMFMHTPVAVGWIAHFMIGTILAVNFGLFFEHAYYYDQGPDRGAYIDAFLANLNWKVVNDLFLKAAL